MSVVPIRQPDEEQPGLPHSLEAEHALLGAALFDNEVVRRVQDTISAEHFFEPVHQRLWAEIAARVSENRLADPATLAEAFRSDSAFNELGGLTFLGDLIDRAFASGAQDYAREIFDTWSRRSLIDLADRARKLALEGRGQDGEALDPHALIAGVRRDLEAVEHASAPGDSAFSDAHAVGLALIDDVEQQLACGKPRGLSTGLGCIDRRLGGLLPEDLIVIGGRPAMGKTALVGNILAGAALHNPSKIFAGFSQEMSNGQLVARNLSRLTAEGDDPVHYERIVKAACTPMEMQTLHSVKSRLPSNLLLRDTPGMTVEGVARAVWALKRRGDLGAVAIDYLQIMRRPQGRGRNEASVIAEMTSALKTLAREARVCIILLSQLNRGVESREDKRPNLGDLRESGSIEQDADVILFPFREVYYLQKAEPREGSSAHLEWEAEVEGKRFHLDVIIAKNRHGAEGTHPQHYDPRVDLIRDKDRP